MKVLLFALASFTAVVVSAATPKYVFLFIGDGMSMPQRMVAEDFAVKIGHGELAMNKFPYQIATRTHSADAIITDSAAAATAIACGEKTNNGVVGLRPDGSKLESVAVVAKRQGMKVGIMTTVTIVHATPAGFYAHRKHRGENYNIGLDLVNSGFDYFAGGGVYTAYDDKKASDYKGNLLELAAKAGFIVNHDDIEGWRNLKPGSKSWNIFCDYGMDFSIDCYDSKQPALAEIVSKGIEVLDNPKGFFIMCEGGKVDYAGHANDAASNLREVLALDDAVRVAIAWQDKHPDETLIITTGDHETGGLSMGFAGIGGKFKVEVLGLQKLSCDRYSREFKNQLKNSKGELKFEDVLPDLKDKFGLDKLSESEKKTLKAAFDEDVEHFRKNLKDTTAHDAKRRYVFAQAAKNALNTRAGIGWSTGGHTALPTLTTAKGCGADILVGMSDNTDISNRLKKLLEQGK